MTNNRSTALFFVAACGLLSGSCAGDGNGEPGDLDSQVMTEIDCSNYCNNRVRCGTITSGECLDLCNTRNDVTQDSFKKAINQCSRQVCSLDGGTCCTQFESCMDQAATSCQMPSNVQVAVDAICGRMAQCGMFPNAAACVTQLGLTLRTFMQCTSSTAISTVASCGASLDCVRPDIGGCLGTEPESPS